jgi:uncharacterized membrane protein
MEQEEIKSEQTGTGGPQDKKGEGAENKKEVKIEDEKLWAASAYVLFFIPLLKEDRSEFVSFHANQGTLFFIFAAAGSIILSLLPFIGWVLFPIFSVIVLVFFILGILNAFGGKMKRLPWFGHLQIVS